MITEIPKLSRGLQQKNGGHTWSLHNWNTQTESQKKKHKHQFYPPIPKSICGKKPIHLLGKSSRLAPFPGYPQPPTRPEKPTIPPSNRPIDRLAHLQGGTGAIDMSIREDLPTTLATRPDLEERATKICREKIRGEILPMDMFPEKLT